MEQRTIPPLNDEEFKLVISGELNTAMFKYILRNNDCKLREIPNLEEARRIYGLFKEASTYYANKENPREIK